MPTSILNSLTDESQRAQKPSFPTNSRYSLCWTSSLFLPMMFVPMCTTLSPLRMFGVFMGRPEQPCSHTIMKCLTASKAHLQIRHLPKLSRLFSISPPYTVVFPVNWIWWTRLLCQSTTWHHHNEWNDQTKNRKYWSILYYYMDFNLNWNCTHYLWHQAVGVIILT